MINWLKGKLGLKHTHLINVKKLFEYRDFPKKKLYCTICKERLK